LTSLTSHIEAGQPHSASGHHCHDTSLLHADNERIDWLESYKNQLLNEKRAQQDKMAQERASFKVGWGAGGKGAGRMPV
jgi:hypothetical protein